MSKNTAYTQKEVGYHVKGLTDILNETSIEYFSLSRPLICESNLIKRWEQDTAPAKCTSCNKCFRFDGTVCIFNR